MQIIKIECYCPDKEKSTKPKYLGDMRVDIAATGRHHCQNCAATWETVSDGNGRIFQRMISRIKLIQVKCEECEKKYKRNFFLGNFQIDVQNQNRFHCKSCNKTYQYVSDGCGNVENSVVSGTIDYSDSVIITGGQE